MTMRSLSTVKLPPSPVASGRTTVLYNPLTLEEETPLISIDSALTVKSPLLPVPKVAVLICPPSLMIMPRLLTVKLPPSPVASGRFTLLNSPLALP